MGIIDWPFHKKEEEEVNQALESGGSQKLSVL
jgi:hypothetical protein